MPIKSTDSPSTGRLQEPPVHGSGTTTQWLSHRLMEKSTWSGASLVVICLLVLFGLPIVKIVAWLGLIYGIYSMVAPG